MHLCVGKVDLSHIHVSAVSVQSYAQSEDLRIARVMLRLFHLKVLPLLGEMLATDVVEIKCVMSLWVR